MACGWRREARSHPSSAQQALCRWALLHWLAAYMSVGDGGFASRSFLRPGKLPAAAPYRSEKHAGLPVYSTHLPQVVLGLALGGVVQRGGIVQDNEDRPEVAQPAASS